MAPPSILTTVYSTHVCSEAILRTQLSSVLRKKRPDPGSGSGMNNPDHISESLETNFFG
jgi:hypothetical protein